MKTYFVIISCVLIVSILAQECGTPLECYIQAFQLLKTDREEMRNTIQRLQKIVEENKQEYLTELQKLKAEHENKINDLITKQQNDVSYLVNQINNLKTYSDSIQQKLDVTNANLNSIHKSAGMYQIDDCGKNTINNPYTGTLGCNDGYRPYQVGRIKAPESGCGANQFICIQ